MITLSVVCLKTDQLAYSYICEDESYLSIAEYRANKRFNSADYRMTIGSDYNQNYNSSVFIDYELIGTIKNSYSPKEYSGQTGY